MKRQSRAPKTVAFLVLLAGFPMPGLPKEGEGSIHTTLVEAVDIELQALETAMEEEGRRRDASQHECSHAFQELMDFTNASDRIEAEGRVFDAWAPLSTPDRSQVDETRDMLVFVVEALYKLGEGVGDGQLTPDKLGEQRQRISKVLQGVEPIVETRRGIDDSGSKALGTTIRVQVPLLATPLKASVAEMLGMRRSIRITSAMLGEVAEQLGGAANLLELEREMLILAPPVPFAFVIRRGPCGCLIFRPPWRVG